MPANTTTTKSAQATVELLAALTEATKVNRQALARMVEMSRQLDIVAARLDEKTRTEGPAKEDYPSPAPRARREQTAAPSPRGDAPAPRSGPHLYAWARERGVVEAVQEIGQGRRFPNRIITWSPEQVRTAYADLTERIERDRAEANDEDDTPY